MRDIAVHGRRGAPDDALPSEEDGFRASLSGAALPDLVQMECLALTEGSFRVISGGQVGYLFFQRGQLTHALVDDLSGEDAALEILEWQRGTFEPCRVAWPEQPTISMNWQNLLLMSARKRDESGRRRLTAVPDQERDDGETSTSMRSLTPPPKPSRSVPGPTSVTRPASTLPPPVRDPSRDTQRSALHVDAPPPPSSPPSHLAQAFVRMDAEGNVVASRGDVEELSQVASYAARLSELIGDALGMTSFSGLESTHESGRHVIHVDAERAIVALRAPLSADLSAIRKKFDL
jgi:hypothetical protein